MNYSTIFEFDRLPKVYIEQIVEFGFLLLIQGSDL